MNMNKVGAAHDNDTLGNSVLTADHNNADQQRPARLLSLEEEKMIKRNEGAETKRGDTTNNEAMAKMQD